MDAVRPRPLRKNHTAEYKRAKAAERAARYRDRDPDRAREQNRRSAKGMDPAMRRRWNLHNRLRRRGAALTDEAREYVEILRRDPCCYCGVAAQHIDHIEPLINGGTSDSANLTSACGSCNTRKGGRSLLAFLMARQHG
jgi:5-methylcytosine-specific restriction endonuclease McrA